MPPVTQSFRGRNLDNVVVRVFYGLHHTGVKAFARGDTLRYGFVTDRPWGVADGPVR